MKFKKKNKLIINPIFIAILLVFIVLLITMFLNKDVDYQKVTSKINSINTQANTYGDYIKTSDLSNADIADIYQKNYQETKKDDGSYLIKTAEWTDKEKGEALITLTGVQNEKIETSCVYVATMCYAHGLTEDIIVKNILILINYYDTVDFIAINNTYEIGVVDAKTFTMDNTEDDIRTYVRETKAAGEEYPHYIYSVIPAIEKYLFGNLGDEYISEDNLINDPTAIYVSCDSIYPDMGVSEFDWGAEYSTDKYFNFMQERYLGRYFSMSQTSQKDPLPQLMVRFPNMCSYDRGKMNAIIGTLNIENYGEADLVLSEESLKMWEDSTIESIFLPYADPKYAAQYSYTTDFEKAGVKIIKLEIVITDVVEDYYEITKVEADTGSDTMKVSIEGQTVTIRDENYIAGDKIDVKIYVKMKETLVTTFDGFANTNAGNAKFISGSNKIEVESPKLSPKISGYTVNYYDKYTNEVIKTEKIVENVAINSHVYFDDEAIDIEGYTFSNSDKDILVVTENGNNIMNLYYCYNSDVHITYVDKETGLKIADDETILGYQGKEYVTEPKVIDKYILAEEADNAVGIMSRSTIEVTYYYLYNITEVSVTKTWNDYSNADKTRPNAIIVNLLQNGKKIYSKEVTENDEWNYTFSELEKYDENIELYNYDVTEETIENYVTTVIGNQNDGYTITNTYTTTFDISGRKIWIDYGNNYETRPESITISLLQNGDVLLDENGNAVKQTVTKEGNWNYVFRDLEKYDSNGNKYVYTIQEENVANYKVAYDRAYNTINILNDSVINNEEKTVAPGVLPNTGNKVISIIVLIVTFIIPVILFSKWKEYKDIK